MAPSRRPPSERLEASRHTAPGHQLHPHLPPSRAFGAALPKPMNVQLCPEEDGGRAVDNARMELRPELCPPVVGPQRIAELCSAIETIAGMLERGESADAAIAGFNAETGRDYGADHFLTYWKSRNLEDFALEAARPARSKVANVTRDEVIEIVRRIQAAEDDIDYYVLLLDATVLYSRVTELIFWPPPELVNASPQAIVDAALSYRPIVL
ncbi:hypothetical protein ABT214_16270 [Micromonospora purpureochromogenes]|uniref:hypothetical protein n=1 Tax=Micromonospora purpureochromogenes TaxID=47872 RepID=UPI003326AE4C